MGNETYRFFSILKRLCIHKQHCTFYQTGSNGGTMEKRTREQAHRWVHVFWYCGPGSDFQNSFSTDCHKLLNMSHHYISLNCDASVFPGTVKTFSAVCFGISHNRFNAVWRVCVFPVGLLQSCLADRSEQDSFLVIQQAFKSVSRMLGRLHLSTLPPTCVCVYILYVWMCSCMLERMNLGLSGWLCRSAGCWLADFVYQHWLDPIFEARYLEVVA